jgi:hypothetical protein
VVLFYVILESIWAVCHAVKSLLRFAANKAHFCRVPQSLVFVRSQTRKGVDDDTENDVEHRNRDDQEEENVRYHEIANVGPCSVTNPPSVAQAIDEALLEAAPQREAKLLVVVEIVLVLDSIRVVGKLLGGRSESESGSGG